MGKKWFLAGLIALTAMAALAMYLQAANGGYTLLGWNNLGMHCMDSDYTIFSILPPYNTIYAQLIDSNGRLVTSPPGFGVTYEAGRDPEGSINSTSAFKTNFWQRVQQLFGVLIPIDSGLARKNMPGAANQPQAMSFDPGSSAFIAEGIPITPYDDAQQKNYYPLMHLVARDSAGNILAATDIVLPVSDEMDCRACHASDSSEAARPAAGWVRDPDPEHDYRLNILLLHDQINANNPVYRSALGTQGYDGNGLFITAASGNRSILCASCHASNALAGTGVSGIPPLTQAMHSYHGAVIDPTNGLTLAGSANRSACYRCHPGSETRCLRGAMGNSVAIDGTLAIQCQDCHGSMMDVGIAGRQGWLDEPNCQSCHTGTATQNSGQIRYTSGFDNSGNYRQPANPVFATNPDTPLPGTSLFRFSKGHGGLFCSACHGSTHAEFPSSHLNDNLQSLQLQKNAGVISDCSTCHNSQPSTVAGGPHGMHPVGQQWVNNHGDVAEHSSSQCQFCHGRDYRGTVLSRALGDRNYSTNFGAKNFWRGFQIGCYACHNGPSSESANPNRPPVVSNDRASTPTGTPVTIPLAASDPNGNPLLLRVVSQPAHGTVALNGPQANYFPTSGYAGPDSFTFSAWDGAVDSNLGRVSIDVVENLLIPFYQESPSSYTGIAVSNYSDRHASLTFTAYDYNGRLLPFAQNPATLGLAPRTQLAKLTSEIFASGVTAPVGGWIQITSDNAQVGCFFQFGSSSQVDGSVAASGPARRFRFTRVYEGAQAFRGQSATTSLSIANPNDQAVTLTLSLVLPRPSQAPSPQTRSIPPKGVLFGSVSQIFGQNLSVSGGYIDVQASGNGAVGFELIEFPETGSDLGLNAVSGSGAPEVYSAQLAVSPAYFTAIKLLNTADAPRSVTLRAVDENGSNLAAPVAVTLEAGAADERDAAEVFAFPPGSTAIGSLVVTSDGPGIAGDVVFGDPASLRFAAALPLQVQKPTKAIFSHVANGQNWFTGLALFNPTQTTSDVMIEVYSSQGTKIGQLATPLALGAGKRISRVLTELIPATVGQMGGSVVLSSSQPIVAQEVFGDTSLTLLSAVPPTIIK